MSSLPLECAGKTDPGRVPEKQVNEDHLRHGPTPFGYLALVCDGMGGHEGGREASALAANTIFERLEAEAAGSTTAGVALKHAIEEANRRVYALGTGKLHGRPGSTVVALLFHEGGVEVAHVGDSRIYRIRGVDCMQLTRDHSQVQLMVDAGMLTPEQAKVHPDANKITRALGIDADVRVEVQAQPQPYLAGDTYLLCSDGLSDLVEPDDMVRLVGGAPLQQAAGQLIDLANARGGHDNITALLVRTKASLPQNVGSGEQHSTQVMPPVGGVMAPVAKTVLSMPAAAAQVPTQAMDAHAPQAAPMPDAHIPDAPAAHASSRTPIVLLLLIALLLLAGLGALFYLHWRDRAGAHKDVPEGVSSSLGPVIVAPAKSEEFEPLPPANVAPSANNAPDDDDDDELDQLAPTSAPAATSGGTSRTERGQTQRTERRAGH